MFQGNCALCAVYKSKSTVKYLEHYTCFSAFPCFNLFFVSGEPRDTLMASGKREQSHHSVGYTFLFLCNKYSLIPSILYYLKHSNHSKTIHSKFLKIDNCNLIPEL